MLATIFDLLAKGFDSIPVLNKFKGYRSAMGLVAMGAVYALDAAHIGPGTLSQTLNPYLTTFTGLALNAKARSV